MYDRRWLDEYYNCLYDCGNRYQNMLNNADGEDDLKEFIQTYKQGCHDKLPIQKLCRWLGNIQGKLHERGYTTDDKERDWTRSLFRPLDFWDQSK